MFISIFVGLLTIVFLYGLYKNASTGVLKNLSSLNNEQLPTVSLCIPARNETHALSECLISAIASTYPKLEILVLDDCSQDKTSQIIRGFSHEGVRFIQGEVPSDGWLGKNNAYATLLEQAKGEYVVFMSVDTRLAQDSVTQLVGYAIQEKLSMISVLPTRDVQYVASLLCAPLRYFWQLIVPPAWRQPVATSLWLANTDKLRQIGGIAKFKENILIEDALAREFSSERGYKFIQANNSLRAYYAKHWSSQMQTSIRLWFPALRRSYVLAVFMCLVHVLFFAGPIVLIYLGDAFYVSAAIWLVCLTVLYFSYLFVITKNILVSVLVLLFLPAVVIQELILIIVSCIQYARGKIDWKGRNVCFPSSLRSLKS